MRLGVNVPNFGPGTSPDILQRWALTGEGLGFDLLMVSDHVAVTPDVAEQYPAPFYEPFTTLAWLAGLTRRIRLGTTVLILPYRHPLLTARMAANLNDLSGGRLVLGVGVGWARQEFDALGVPFRERGRLTDLHLLAIRAAWADAEDYRSGPVPVWIGGNSDAALRRVAAWGDGWYGFNLAGVDAVAERLATLGELCREGGRDIGELEIAVALEAGEPADAPALGELGVDELVLVQAPPEDPSVAAHWAQELARRWNTATS